MFVGLSIICWALMTVQGTTNAQPRHRMMRRKHSQKPMESMKPMDHWIQQQVHQREANYHRMAHPVIPPLQRGPFGYDMPGEAPNFVPSMPISIPTRGEYGPFQQVGYIYDVAEPKHSMPLMGRRIHSNKYEYYSFNHYNQAVKIPIKVTGDREVSDGDNIPITGYTNNFKVKLYDLDVPRYLPY